MTTPSSVTDEYDMVDHEEASLSLQELEEIRNWLQPTDYLAESGEFRRHLSSRAPKTGLWICDTDEYKKWYHSVEHGSLWIKGVPGAGKSVMAASVINHLRTTEDCPILYFFFRNIVAANFSPRALIQDWLAQLLPHSSRLQFSLQLRLKTSLAETSDNELFQMFLDGLSSIPKCFGIVDALDEMEMNASNRPFLDKLNALATYRPESIKILITSRPKQYLQSALRDSSIVHISLQQRLVDADIAAYLQHRFDKFPKTGNIQEIKQRVINMVAKISQGLFLVAKLTMDQSEASVEASLLTGNPVDILALEKSLPNGLEQTYNSLLAKQREENGVSLEIQRFVLEAITHSSRPLRLNELASLMKCVYPNVDAPAGFKVLISTCCAPLIEILEDETLQIIHHSLTEFLRGETRSSENADTVSGFPTIEFGKAHKHMAINCLRYLQSGSLLLEGESSESTPAESIAFQKPRHRVNLDEEQCKRSRLGLKTENDSFDYKQARLRYQFLSYAVENWPYHASLGEEDEELSNAVLGFFQFGGIASRRWHVLRWRSTSARRKTTEGLPTGLHVAAFSGLPRLAVKLIEEGASVSAVDAQGRIPLHWAAANGHTMLVSLLIQHKSNPDMEDGYGHKPIHLAAQKNHSEVVKVLLEAGVEPDTAKVKENHAGRLLGGETITKGECAIFYASASGHTETIITMIPFCKPEVLERLLCECSRFGRTEAVLAILEKSDVSANATYRGATALYFACGITNVKCVEALIRRGANVNQKSIWNSRRTRNGGPWGDHPEDAPIHTLVRSWRDDNDSSCRAILRMLIKAGADLEQINGDGNTALLISVGAPSRRGRAVPQVPALRALLDAGADFKKIHESGDMPMNLVLRQCRNLEVIRLLLKHGGDPNYRGRHGETVLHCSLDQPGMLKDIEDTEAIVKLLLENGADPNIQDDYGLSAVYKGMSAGVAVFRMLLARCNDDATKKRCWFGLCNQSKIENFNEYLKLLLAEGIDINVGDDYGRTLYLKCLTSEDMLRTLRSHGAKIDAVDNGGNNSLHLLSQNASPMREHLERRIVDDRMDALSTNHQGDTLLHHVASWYNGEPKAADYVRWLISLGISVNAVNKKGFTALHTFQTKYPGGSTIHSKERIHFVDAINELQNVDFGIRNNDGLTALHLAAMSSGINVALLVEAGADPAFLTRDSQNLLHLASQAREPNIVCQILQMAIADLNQKDRFGRTPLHYACSSGQAESVALLLKYGADTHIVDADGLTPLHACAQSALDQNIWAVYEHQEGWLRSPPRGVYRPSWSVASTSPWYRGRYGGRIKAKNNTSDIEMIVKMLLDAECDVSAVNKSKLTALDIALLVGCIEFIEIFAKDEALFAEATKSLDDDEETAERSEEIRQKMRAQMELVRPRSALGHLSENQSVLNEVIKSPATYLELLTCDDAAQLINKGFDANPLDSSYYNLLKELMKPGHTKVVEQVSPVILQYSTHDSVGKKIERERREGVSYYESRAETPLQLACRQSVPNMLTLQLLVEKMHVDLNAQGSSIIYHHSSRSTALIPMGTALHILASANHAWQLEGIKYLLAHGANVDALDEQGQSPLHIAARGKRHVNHEIEGFWRWHAVRILLDHGANMDLLDEKGFSPLHKAAAAPDIMKELLRRGANPTIGVRSPLFLAISKQNLSALETLLDHGLSVDSLDENHPSRAVHYTLTEPRKVYALLCAAFAEELNTRVPQSVPLLRTLVKRGANLYLPLNDTETLVHFMFEYPEWEVLDALLDEPCVSRIDFNRRDQRGRSVLIASCDWREVLAGYWHKRRDEKAVGPPLRILDRGADATLVDAEGRTALHHLLDNTGMPDEVLVQFINRSEVFPTLFLKDKQGFSPFHYALRVLRPEVCKLLLSKGADILEPDPNGLTVLHYVASRCLETSRRPAHPGRLAIDLPEDYFDQCLALWQRFIEEGGSINVADNAGNTPFHTYLSSGYTTGSRSSAAIVDCHLHHYDRLFPPDSGVDIFAVNGEGETALHVVAKNERKDYSGSGHDKKLFEALMAKGLDPLKEDARGRSPLDVASACEKNDLVAILARK